MKKLFIAAAVIVMAGSMASCEAVTPESEIPAAAESQKTQPEQANNK